LTIFVTFARKLFAIAIGLAASTIATPARADLASLKNSCVTKFAVTTPQGPALPYTFCDDGLPPVGVGGRAANEGAKNAVAVPEKYLDYDEQPIKAKAEQGTGADGNGDIALDADVSIPDHKLAPPPSGYPLIVMLHGCCWGDKTQWEAPDIEPLNLVNQTDERWHYNNAWFAARGYVVLNYTSRGFVSSIGQGSTGETQINSRLYELKDLQYLTGLLADDKFFNIDPTKIVVTGGSMGGGLAWLALTHPVWKSPAGRSMHIVAVAPLYGWTDLLYSLVPTGRHYRDSLPDIHGCDSGEISGCQTRFGFEKHSILKAFFLQGLFGVPLPGLSSHATYTPEFNESFVCLNSPIPIDHSCSVFVNTVAPAMIFDRSAYYQNAFFSHLSSSGPDRIQPVPVFSAGTFTDPLFTGVEHRRMVERLKKAVPNYPVQEYYGDYAHFVSDKAKEWADMCGSGHHVCMYSDYDGDLNKDPPGIYQVGINTRLNRFLDYFAVPPGDPGQNRPRFDVTASLQICPSNAVAIGVNKDEPGPRYEEDSFALLAPNTLKIVASCEHKVHTSNFAVPNLNAQFADPITTFLVANLQPPPGDYCVSTSYGGGPGVATFETGALDNDFNMIGRTRVTVTHSGQGSELQLNARLYDVDVSHDMAQMVDRGVRRIDQEEKNTIFDLDGNGWRFLKGHSIRVELAQDDDPYIKRSLERSSLLLKDFTLELPIREGSASLSATCR